jgi:hypothetical protein
MSNKDQLRLIDADSDHDQRINPSNIDGQTANEAQVKKKKMLKWGLIGGGITIAIVIIIVLSVVLTKKSEDPPIPPFFPQGYNLYSADPSAVVDKEDSFSGIIKTKTT